MSNKEVVVSDVSREHENPIAELVQVACQFDSNIVLENDNRKINAKSIMGIMAFNPTRGMTVNIVDSPSRGWLRVMTSIRSTRKASSFVSWWEPPSASLALSMSTILHL